MIHFIQIYKRLTGISSDNLFYFALLVTLCLPGIGHWGAAPKAAPSQALVKKKSPGKPQAAGTRQGTADTCSLGHLQPE